MQYKIDLKIQEGDFPNNMTKEDISEYLKGKITDSFSNLFHSEFEMPPVGHNTTEVKMGLILILNPTLFYEKIIELLDDPGLSKKEFLGKLLDLINSSK